MEYAPNTVMGLCAVHPDQPARRTCPRCGDFFCDACAQYTQLGDAVCSRCPAPVSTINASLGARFGGSMADGLVAIIPLGIALAIAYASNLMRPENTLIVTSFVMLAGLALTGAIQLVVMLMDPWRRSIGKRLAGTRVARPDGSVPEMWRIIVLRNLVLTLAGFIPYVGNFVGFADAVAIFGNDRKCLHDYIADTIVVEHNATTTK